MEMQTYLSAKDLVEDTKKISRIIEEVERKQHWITVSTPDWITVSTPDNQHNQLRLFSLRFQNDLVEWLKSVKEKYEKDFDELS